MSARTRRTARAGPSGRSCPRPRRGAARRARRIGTAGAPRRPAHRHRRRGWRRRRASAPPRRRARDHRVAMSFGVGVHALGLPRGAVRVPRRRPWSRRARKRRRREPHGGGAPAKKAPERRGRRARLFDEGSRFRRPHASGALSRRGGHARARPPSPSAARAPRASGGCVLRRRRAIRGGRDVTNALGRERERERGESRGTRREARARRTHTHTHTHMASRESVLLRDTERARDPSEGRSRAGGARAASRVARAIAAGWRARGRARDCLFGAMESRRDSARAARGDVAVFAPSGPAGTARDDRKRSRHAVWLQRRQRRSDGREATLDALCAEGVHTCAARK